MAAAPWQRRHGPDAARCTSTTPVAVAASRGYGVPGARELIAARLEAAMFELAFDLEGNPIEVPSAAVGWRVRKLGLRGRPEVVYGRDGLPLIVPIDATLAELRSAVQLEGRYRLDPVDEQRREIAGARSAYVRLVPPAGPAAACAATSSSVSSDAAETVIRANLDLAKIILGQVELLLGVARGLLRTAEDASQAIESNPDLVK
jgi:hypothetical protein